MLRRPNWGLGFTFAITGRPKWSRPRSKSPTLAKVPGPSSPASPEAPGGDSSGWLKTLLKSAPTSSFVVSENLKYFRRPRLTPHEPGPTSELRLAIEGSSKTVESGGGGPKAAGLKNWSPSRFAYGLPMTVGRNVGPVKSPTASTKPLAMFPGKTGSQLLQNQK